MASGQNNENTFQSALFSSQQHVLEKNETGVKNVLKYDLQNEKQIQQKIADINTNSQQKITPKKNYNDKTGKIDLMTSDDIQRMKKILTLNKLKFKKNFGKGAERIEEHITKEVEKRINLIKPNNCQHGKGFINQYRLHSKILSDYEIEAKKNKGTNPRFFVANSLDNIPLKKVVNYLPNNSKLDESIRSIQNKGAYAKSAENRRDIKPIRQNSDVSRKRLNNNQTKSFEISNKATPHKKNFEKNLFTKDTEKDNIISAKFNMSPGKMSKRNNEDLLQGQSKHKLTMNTKNNLNASYQESVEKTHKNETNAWKPTCRYGGDFGWQSQFMAKKKKIFQEMISENQLLKTQESPAEKNKKKTSINNLDQLKSNKYFNKSQTINLDDSRTMKSNLSISKNRKEFYDKIMSKVKSWKYSKQKIDYFEKLNLDEDLFRSEKSPALVDRTSLPQIITNFSYNPFNNFARLDDQMPEVYSKKNGQVIGKVDSKTSFYKREKDFEEFNDKLWDINQEL